MCHRIKLTFIILLLTLKFSDFLDKNVCQSQASWCLICSMSDRQSSALLPIVPEKHHKYSLSHTKAKDVLILTLTASFFTQDQSSIITVLISWLQATLTANVLICSAHRRHRENSALMSWPQRCRSLPLARPLITGPELEAENPITNSFIRPVRLCSWGGTSRLTLQCLGSPLGSEHCPLLE